MDEPVIVMVLKEPVVRAMHSAVCFTLGKWAGQEPIDQEALMKLRTALQGCIFEFDFGKEKK